MSRRRYDRNAMPAVNFIAAGDVLRRRILAIEPTIQTWCNQHTRCPDGTWSIHPNSVHQICDGAFNGFRGPSIPLLLDLCNLIEDGDARAAQLLAAAYLAAANVIPHNTDIVLASEMAHARKVFESVADDVRLVVSREERKAKRAAHRAASGGEADGSAAR